MSGDGTWRFDGITHGTPYVVRRTVPFVFLALSCTLGCAQEFGEGRPAITSEVDAGGPPPGEVPSDTVTDVDIADDTESPGDASPGDESPGGSSVPDDSSPSPPSDDTPSATDLPPGTHEVALVVGAMQRDLLVRIPQGFQGDAPGGVMIAFHGNGGTPEGFAAGLQLYDIADSTQTVVILPRGIAQTVTAYGQTISGIYWDAYRSLAEGNIDLALADAIVQEIAERGWGDPSRLHVLGYSQGGYLACRLAMERANVLASVVVAAAASPLGPNIVSWAQRPIPMGLVVGELDPAASSAYQLAQQLESAGHEVAFEVVANAGHVPFPGPVAPWVDWLLAHPLATSQTPSP